MVRMTMPRLGEGPKIAVVVTNRDRRGQRGRRVFGKPGRLLSHLLPVLGAGVLVSGACVIPSPREELKRVVSPDSLVEAVIVREGGSPTVDYGYEVYIVPFGDPLPRRPRFGATNVADLEVVWPQARLLQIRYRRAKIDRFVNWWHSAKLENYRYVVELQLVPLTDGWALSERDRGNW